MVSVIIPNYNHSAFLQQRISSVLQQTYRPLEIILLDDCSTDNSKDVLQQYETLAEVTHVVYNKVNSGSTFAQWRKGITLAKGEYIWIAESDDVADDCFLEKCMHLFGGYKSLALVYTQSRSIDETGALGDSWLSHTNHFGSKLWDSDFTMNGVMFAKKYMLVQNSLPNASAVVFKKQTYVDAGGVNETFKLNGDWDMYTRLMQIADVGFIAEPLNYFRQHSNKGSSANIANGNNVAEYYYLLRNWRSLFSLTSAETAKLATHIFSIWKWQSHGSLLRMLKKNFAKIFTAALQVDKRIGLKLLRLIK